MRSHGVSIFRVICEMSRFLPSCGRSIASICEDWTRFVDCGQIAPHGIVDDAVVSAVSHHRAEAGVPAGVHAGVPAGGPALWGLHVLPGKAESRRFSVKLLRRSEIV